MKSRPTRRQVLLHGSALAAAPLLPSLGCRSRTPEPIGPDAAPSFLTPIEDFYVFSKGPMPSPWTGGGALRILEEGREDQEVPWEQVRALATRRIPRTLICDGHGFTLSSMGGQPPDFTMENWRWRFGACSTAEWDVVLLKDLLAACGRSLSGSWVTALSRDDDQWVYPTAFAAEHLWVAVGMNGQPLPHKHGAPARLLAEGEYGGPSIKWLSELHLNADIDGEREYEHRLFHRVPAAPVAYATTPHDGEQVEGDVVELQGLVYAGASAPSSVQLWFGERNEPQTETWQAELLDPPRPYVWSRWRSRFQLPGGSSSVCIACVSADGRYSMWVPDEMPDQPTGWGGIQVLRLNRA